MLQFCQVTRERRLSRKVVEANQAAALRVSLCSFIFFLYTCDIWSVYLQLIA